MKSSWIISAFLSGLLLISSVRAEQSSNFDNKTKQMRNYLKKINKPAVKTIQSPDGDIIDCVSTHLQPAFDHPILKGQKPIMDPPDMPEGHTSDTENFEKEFQVWRMSGESCPENTVPIRRTTQEDVLRANSVKRFGRKLITRPVTKFMDDVVHQRTGGYVNIKCYGAKAAINLWAPKVADPIDEDSSSKIWIMAGSNDNADLNAIEVGWQVNPSYYGDARPRLYTRWTSDGYNTSCIDLRCPGFIHTSRTLALGVPFQHISSYNGDQFEIIILVWREPEYGNWWLSVMGIPVGYWPRNLFTHLNDSASIVYFGGEVRNPGSGHTSTQMGSGHFPRERSKRAAYFRNLQVVTGEHALITVPDFQLVHEDPNCYDIVCVQSNSLVWGTYFYYGGPGKNYGKNKGC